MTFQELLKGERAAGRADSVIDLLGEVGEVPEELDKTIRMERDEKKLSYWLKLAAKADSIDLFVKKMNSKDD